MRGQDGLAKAAVRVPARFRVLAPSPLNALNARPSGGARGMKITGVTTKEFCWPRLHAAPGMAPAQRLLTLPQARSPMRMVWLAPSLMSVKRVSLLR